jgi:hypothetical protein
MYAARYNIKQVCFSSRKRIFDSKFFLNIKKLCLIFLNAFRRIISTPHALFPPEAMTEGTCAVQMAGFTELLIM